MLSFKAWIETLPRQMTRNEMINSFLNNNVHDDNISVIALIQRLKVYGIQVIGYENVEAVEIKHKHTVKPKTKPKIKPKVKQKKHYCKISQDDVNEIIKLYNMGISIPRLAKNYGAAYITMLRLIKKVNEFKKAV